MALPARNLAIAERDGLRRPAGPLPDVLDGADEGRSALAASADAALQQRCPRSSNCDVAGDTQVLNLIQVFQKIGLEQIQATAVRPLGRVPARPATTAAC